MGKFKRMETSVNGSVRPKKDKVVEVKRSSWGHKEVPPETPEQEFKRKRACALIMCRRFGVRDWHRGYLTGEEIGAIEEDRREVGG